MIVLWVLCCSERMSVLVIPEESTTTTTIVELVYSRGEVEIYVRARTLPARISLGTHSFSSLLFLRRVFFSTWSSKRKKAKQRGREKSSEVKNSLVVLGRLFFPYFYILFFFLWCIDVEWVEIHFRLFFHPLISLLHLLFSNQINWNLKFPFGFIAAIEMLWVLEPSKD